MKRFVIVAILLFLTGCSSFDASQARSVPDYRQGNGGIELSFLSQMPPREVPQNGPFRIGVKVQNSGAYDIGEGSIAVVGLNDAWTPLEHDELRLPPLRGKSVSAPDGDFFLAEFSGKNIAIPPGVSEYRSKFWVSARYNYQSSFQQDVCVNPDIFEGINRGTGVCTMQPSVSLGGQGAPLAVTRIEEIVTPTQDTMALQFTFTIDNRGSGQLVSPVTLDDVKLGTRRMTCDRHTIESKDIDEKRNKVVCRVTEPLRSAYTTSVSLSLYYTYLTKKQGEFLIRRQV